MFIILKKIFFGGIILGSMINSGMGQTKFSAVISPSQISKDEYATLRLIFENATDIQKITPPSFADFSVVSGPNQESGMSNVNGVVTQYIAISYILQPRHAGNIVLAAASAQIAGKKYSAPALKLSVKKSSGLSTPNNISSNPFASQQPSEDFTDFILKKGEHVPDKVNKNMLLKLQTSRISCFVGEPIIADYKLYSRLKSESRLTKNPSFNGFSVIDIQQPDATAYVREKLNGREYNVYSIRKAQLYPLQDGTIELESATLENNIQFLKEDASNLKSNMDGYINGFSYSPETVITETVSLSSKPLRITVKPLPLAGKPASFNGAVGKFEVTASVEKNQFHTDETGKLTLVVSGNGNLQLVTAPEIKWPQPLEAFEPKVTDELVQMDVPVSGKKIFEIPFAVQTAGNYEVPSIEFSFFDPSTAAYKIIQTKPISISVKKGNNKPAYFADTASKKSMLPIAVKMLGSRGWMVVVLAVMMMLGLFFWIKKDHKKKKEPLLNLLPVAEDEKELGVFATTNVIPQNPLSLSENCLNSADCRDFYSLLNQELKDFLANKFSLSAKDINVKLISMAMDKAGIDNEISLQMQQLMQDIEWQLYTPFERNNAMNHLYNRTQSIIQLIHTYHSPTL
jgi:hypothetical protein